MVTGAALVTQRRRPKGGGPDAIASGSRIGCRGVHRRVRPILSRPRPRRSGLQTVQQQPGHELEVGLVAADGEGAGSDRPAGEAEGAAGVRLEAVGEMRSTPVVGSWAMSG